MGETKDGARDDPFRMQAPDFDALAANAAKIMEEGAKLQAAYLKPVERGEPPAAGSADEVQEVVRTLGAVAQSWLADPQRARTLQGEVVPVPRLLG